MTAAAFVVATLAALPWLLELPADTPAVRTVPPDEKVRLRVLMGPAGRLGANVGIAASLLHAMCVCLLQSACIGELQLSKECSQWPVLSHAKRVIDGCARPYKHPIATTPLIQPQAVY